VPVSRLATLQITSPGTEEAQPRLAVALVSADGIVLSEARPLLAVMRAERFAPQPSAVLPALSAQCPARLRPPKAAEEPAAAWVWPGARHEAKSLVRRGDDALARGSIGAARQTYEYVADEMRWSTAALALAATYDPHELAYLAPLVVADAEKARAWYEQARALADARIEFHLRRLGPPARAPAEPLQPMGPEPAPVWVWFGAMEAQTIVRWGDEALARGSIEAARQIYEYAAVVMRWPTAALSLAATYDKEELVHLGRPVTSEPEKARAWYERSLELMDARIDFHLQRLGAPKVSRRVAPGGLASCG
jgi:tetratricopeptide (TPR) repeat protein